MRLLAVLILLSALTALPVHSVADEGKGGEEGTDRGSESGKTDTGGFDDYGASNSRTGALGVNPNCNETSMTNEQFQALAADPSIKSAADFNRRLPAGSFQTFTLVYNSLSGQRGVDEKTRVRCEWPRVLRMSNDGRITYSYTCDPKSETYGKLETIIVDNKSQLNTATYDLTKSSGAGEGHRTHHNPQSCVQCHSYSAVGGKPLLKFNWQEYFNWTDCKENRGIQMFGGFDDGMFKGSPRYRGGEPGGTMGSDCSHREDEIAFNKEQECYAKFRETQKDNPCYNTLPWGQLKEDTDDATKQYLSSYPYAASEPSDGILDLEVRPNLKITNIYSSQTANRNAQVIMDSAKYEDIKYFLLMEAAGCPLTDDERANFAKLSGISLADIPKADEYNYRGTNEVGTALPLLNAYAKSLGFRDGDWSLDFNTPDQKRYNNVVPLGSGSYSKNLGELTAGTLFKAASVEEPRLADTGIKLTTGYGGIWGGAVLLPRWLRRSSRRFL